MGVAKRLQLPEDQMGDRWNQWIGQIIDGKFRLVECRDSSEFAAVFVCESVQGGTAPTLIKLLRCDAENAPEQAESWAIAARLSHPNLIRVLAAGKTKLADTEFSYAVTERGEFDLTQMLAERALTAADWAAVQAAFAANDDPLAGVGEGEYRRLFQRIAQMAPAPVGLGAPWKGA